MKNILGLTLTILLPILPITAQTKVTPSKQSLVFTHVTVIDSGFILYFYQISVQLRNF